MLNDNEFQELVEDLSSTDVSIRVAALEILCQEPLEDERVLPHLEALLNDTTPCVVMLPYRFGEIRWLAAKALVAERAALGHSEPVRLHGVIQPFDTEEFTSLALAAGVKSGSGVDGVLKAFVILREMGRLPLYDLELVPNIKNKQDNKIDNLISSNGTKSEKVVIQTLESSAISKSYTNSEFNRDENTYCIDFSSDPKVVWAVVEGERLTYGHLFNPTFATETSIIEPLPHQRIAVYEYLLKQPRLRFMLADDAGAGKTIMTGLYIREMLSRRLINRVLIVPPAGLVGNWEREMKTLFSLTFRVVSGSEAKSSNPFTSADSDLLIVSVDTLAGNSMLKCLSEPEVVPYDLVIFDEAHKLSADREADFYIRKSKRYLLAEALAGSGETEEDHLSLPWHCHHLLLLTATPHMGKEFPYYCLWRLLEPEVLSTIEAFNAYPADARRRHFIRRTKEEMVYYDERPIYPMRISDTLSYELTQGEISEQTLYDETTNYIQSYYNRAKILNRSAARLAMSVFQRRLASSTYALIKSFERRRDKLNTWIADIESGRISIEDLGSKQRELDKNARDVLDEKTADEEAISNGKEESEAAQEDVLEGVAAVSISELKAEKVKVEYLLDLAIQVYDIGQESKFEKLREFLTYSEYEKQKIKGEKIIIFTEHRDTLTFLVDRLEGMGFTGRVATLHGGMPYSERDKQIEFFRKPASDGGATYLVATDAAGEGINLQFCWLMINYDIPWNPARLEQRMGRIHRFGQKHDPVIIINLVAGKTREGRVLKTLLDKLEKIRKELGSDKVFDVVGRVFEGVSIKQYMEEAMTEEEAVKVVQQIEQSLTQEKVKVLQQQEEKLFGIIGDVRAKLPQLNVQRQHEELRRLLPGHVRRFVEKAAPLVGISIEGDLNGYFHFRAKQPGSLDWLLPFLEVYSAEQQSEEVASSEIRLTFHKPKNKTAAIFLHPGEPIFERFRQYICGKFAQDALKGGIFVDTNTKQPYIFHILIISVIREADLTQRQLARKEVLESRLVGLKYLADGCIEEVAPEYLTLLKEGKGIPPQASSLVATAKESCELAKAYALDFIAQKQVLNRREALKETLPERIQFLKRGYDYQESELLLRRQRLREKANADDPRAKGEITKIKNRQRQLTSLKEQAITTLHREPELIVPGDVTCIAHALVIPSADPEDKKRQDKEIEAIAMQKAREYEESLGATVRDVSTPELARYADLTDYPGFDLLSQYPDGKQLSIEVKGRAGIGNVELTENEWVAACNLRERYWLYVVFNCASPHPRLIRIKDPFGKLIVKTKTSVLIDAQDIFQAAES
ncbi:helicase-like protein (plasmid) [Calothrix sp. NIES-2100]|uniref:helicase-related protein n=1 Tax=Calothrix sp. NIES-2100 TaxID=1954172 RepID=UPI000B61618B|nr:helicase-like protein [Calothrix sp. NIES-2100]